MSLRCYGTWAQLVFERGSAIGDNGARSVKLTILEIRLFGPVGENEHGQPFIWPENDIELTMYWKKCIEEIASKLPTTTVRSYLVAVSIFVTMMLF